MATTVNTTAAPIFRVEGIEYTDAREALAAFDSHLDALADPAVAIKRPGSGRFMRATWVALDDAIKAQAKREREEAAQAEIVAQLDATARAEAHAQAAEFLAATRTGREAAKKAYWAAERAAKGMGRREAQAILAPAAARRTDAEIQHQRALDAWVATLPEKDAVVEAATAVVDEALEAVALENQAAAAATAAQAVAEAADWMHAQRAATSTAPRPDAIIPAGLGRIVGTGEQAGFWDAIQADALDLLDGNE